MSFHNNAGSQANDTTTTNNLAILLPVINGADPVCRKQHIPFVCLQMNMDFASIVTVNPPGMTVLQA
jgi:hypothetical protein